MGGSTAIGYVREIPAVLMRVMVESQASAGLPVAVHVYNQTTAPATGTAGTILTCVQVGPGQALCDFSPWGIPFSSGIAYSVTGGILDSDTTTIPAASRVTLIFKP